LDGFGNIFKGILETIVVVGSGKRTRLYQGNENTMKEGRVGKGDIHPWSWEKWSCQLA
jgi:hypothetical protein